MTNEDKFISVKDIRLVCDPWKDHGVKQYTAKEIADALSRDRWISVEERLPEPKTEVMVAYDDGEVWCLWQNWANDTEDDRLEYYTNDYAIHTVTHWRELPQPPKEDKP